MKFKYQKKRIGMVKEKVKEVLREVCEADDFKDIILHLSKLYEGYCNTEELRQILSSITYTAVIIKTKEGKYKFLLPKTLDVLENMNENRISNLVFPVEEDDGEISYYNKSGNLSSYCFIIEAGDMSKTM